MGVFRLFKTIFYLLLDYFKMKDDVMWEKLFSDEDIQEIRTPDELSQWLATLFGNLETARGGKEAVRLRKGLCKELVEEVFPLSKWANLVYPGNNEIKLEPVLGNQNYDALIHGGASEIRVEVTQAHEGENEFLRRLMLHREGSAPAHGKILKTGTKRTGISVKAKVEAVSHEGVVSQTIEHVENAINNKISKTYDDNTVLLVMFEDSLIFEDADISKLDKHIERFLEGVDTPFAKIYVLGWSGKVLLEY